MKSTLPRLWNRFANLFSSRSKLRTNLRRQRIRSRFLRVEGLEDRRLLARYVDDPTGFTITTNQGTAGLDAGDTVTWDPGPGSAHSPTPVTNLTFGTDAFTSIQPAVDIAAPGEEIKVGSGTFAETVTVNKQLFVLGNQVDVDAQAGRPGAPETIVTGLGAPSAGATPFNVTASDVELNGFTIEGNTNGNQFGFGILLGAGTSGSEVRNNIVQNNIAGLSLANASTTNQTVIEQNLFRNNNNPGPVSGTGIYTDQFNAGGALNNVLIDNNTFLNNDNVAVLIGPTSAALPATGITISSNIMTGNGNGVLLFNTLNSSISSNEITNSVGTQVLLGGGVNGLTVNNNFVSNGGTRGIRIGEFGGGGTNQNITINRNSITGNAMAGLEIDSAVGAYTGTLDATLNWWGSSTGPTIASNPGGMGEEIVDPNNQVDYTPFLTNGTDTQPTVRGFQPVISEVSITKTDAPDPVTPGAMLTYTIVVSNTGPDAQDNAVIADTFPSQLTNVTFTSVASAGVTGNTASGMGNINDTVDMPAGSTITYTVLGTVAQSATGTITNTATITPQVGTNETDTTNNSATATTAVGPAQADLSVTKTDTPDPVTAGNNITYTITVNNAGPSDAQSVTLNDTIPTNTTFVSFTAPAGWSPTTPSVGGTGIVTATRPTLAAGSVAQVFTLVVMANSSAASGSTITNTVTISAATADPVSANNSDMETTGVNTLTDISVTKTDNPDPVNAGDNLTYTITVTNAGPSDAASVTLTDAVPANTTFVSFTQISGPTFTPMTPSPGGTGPVTATAPSLPDTAVFRLVVNVNSSTPQGGTITNAVTVTTSTTGDDPGNNADTETTTVNAQADLRVTKTESADEVDPGANITYTITLTNAGPSDAQTVALTDVLPAGTTFVSASQTSGPAFTIMAPPAGGTGTVTATTPTLADGATATFELVVMVDATAAPGSTISNTVTVTSTTADANPGNNTDTEDTDVTPQGLEECSVETLNSPGPEGSVRVDDVDLDSPGENVLIITGTSGRDIILIEPQPRSRGVFRVVRNNRVILTFASRDVDNIVVFALAGNDKVVVNGSMTQDAKLFGDSGNDELFSARGQDGLDGGPGNDRLFGGSGSDELCGEDGNDFLYGQGGNDTLGGEGGNDQLFGEAGNDFIQGNEGNDKAFGGSGNDQVFGQEGNDQLFGDNGNDIVVGGTGNDKLIGGAGRDILIGGEGADQLFGSGDDDILVAGSSVHDEDQEALEAILSEWVARRNYTTRVNNIRFGGGNNGVFTLDDTTVIDDFAADTLWGQSGQDWFLAFGNDRIKDRARNELVN